jgi:hypothetical protein
MIKIFEKEIKERFHRKVHDLTIKISRKNSDWSKSNQELHYGMTNFQAFSAFLILIASKIKQDSVITCEHS